MGLWSIHSCFRWCKKYKNRSRIARVIVENKWFLFMEHRTYTSCPKKWPHKTIVNNFYNSCLIITIFYQSKCASIPRKCREFHTIPASTVYFTRVNNNNNNNNPICNAPGAIFTDLEARSSGVWPRACVQDKGSHFEHSLWDTVEIMRRECSVLCRSLATLSF